MKGTRVGHISDVCGEDGIDGGTCPNGPDEYGHWPCIPQPSCDGYANCQVCGWRGRWQHTPFCAHDNGERVGTQAGISWYQCADCGLIFPARAPFPYPPAAESAPRANLTVTTELERTGE